MEDSSHELIDQMIAEERYCYGFETIPPGNITSSQEQQSRDSLNNQETKTSSSQVPISSRDHVGTLKELTGGSSLAYSGQENVTETGKVPMSKWRKTRVTLSLLDIYNYSKPGPKGLFNFNA
jgi:hypothetical protein